MCGIAAIINGDIHEVQTMGATIQSRGISFNISSVNNLIVWFSWLPIVNDKIPPQPFNAGKYTVWMNGFISNYKELAEKHSIDLWVDSDTLLLAKFLEKFKGERLDELNGFFSVLYHDGENVEYFTDRYGIKQLYIYENNNKTYISSEVKALLSIMPNPELNKVSVEDWKHSLGVMTDNTIYKDISRVKPKIEFNINPPKLDIDYEEAKDKLKELLDRSFKRNQTSKQKGVFLSGGIDSGIINKNINPEYCFSMDYLTDLSEIENIKLNSNEGAIHITMICNDQLFNKYIDKTIAALDDPKVGSSYTNFAITELASKYCRVLYSGAGGDELFYGYQHRYNKPINQVIKRTEASCETKYNISHEEYDWRFLRGILVVEDRMGGAHTVETRYPFLDNDVVDFVLKLPRKFRENKRILKDISGLHPQVIEGKKRGFSNPHLTNTQWTEKVLDETYRLYQPI